MKWIRIVAGALALLLLQGTLGTAASADLPDTVEAIRASVVAVGTYQTTRRPPATFRGTGFVVGDGQLVVTNNHVIPNSLDEANRERLAIFAGRGKAIDMRSVTVVARDTEHDLALLRVSGSPLKPLRLGDESAVREGQAIAFTGFPIGMVLGLYHVTHRGIVSAITPIVIPGFGGKDLSPQAVKALRDPYDVYQLDATAYPGSSGSPVYDAGTGEVIGIVNSVLVKATKEAVLENPSGITYAIPVRFLKALMGRRGG